MTAKGSVVSDGLNTCRKQCLGRAGQEVFDRTDVFVGTAGLGHVTPAATYPFGMVQAGPDTSFLPRAFCPDWAHACGYQHNDTWLWRFSQTHLSDTGCASLGDIAILPVVGTFDGASRPARMQKKSETAAPGRYGITIEEDGQAIRCDIAALAHTAYYRLQFPKGGEAKLLLDLDWGIGYTGGEDCWIRRVTSCACEFPSPVTARGGRHVFNWSDYKVFFAMEFSAPVDSRRQVRAAGGRRSALYRTMVQPNDLGDVGGKPFFSTLSLWDTFRAAHPLYTIIVPERVDGMVDSMLRQYDAQGYLPVWALGGSENHCMIGKHAVPVIADAYLKGFRGFDAEKAWRAVKDSLTQSHKAVNDGTWGLMKEDWDALEKYGYYPFDKLTGSYGRRGRVRGESVSRTLEVAYDDACAARFAAALGKTDEARHFAVRAENWRNVFDPKAGFMRGKDSKGNWREPFDPWALGGGPWNDNDFCEGNSWQYTWHVMQDPEGLVATLALGAVPSGLARVSVNGRDCGTVWCEPWEADFSAAIRPGRNELEIRYTNNWSNRLIGDCALAETQRVTRSVLRYWNVPRKGWKPTVFSGYAAGDPLQSSGLLGPIEIRMEK